MNAKNDGHICIIGTGYVGVASAIGLAELGWDVVGYDVIRERIRALANGQPPYKEEGLVQALRGHLASGKLRFSESLRDAAEGARFILVGVATPANDDGSADLSDLRNAVDELKRLSLGSAIVVVRSTVPPGTSDLLAERLGGYLPVLYSPEFLREGTSVDDFLHPSRIVIGGSDQEAGDAYAALFAAIETQVVRTSSVEAELIKGLSNAFLGARISLANEAANLCEAVGADAPLVLSAVGADPRIGKAWLAPGIGFGGPCLDKDIRSLQYVAHSAGVGSAMLSATLAVNDAQPSRIVEILEDELGALTGTTIGIWGLTYKAGTDDVRHSLAVTIVRELAAKGARVRAYDPALSDVPLLMKCELVADPLIAADADALMVLTDWPAFRDIAPEALAYVLRRRIVIDGRNVLDHHGLTRAGITYRGVGRRTSSGRSRIIESTPRPSNVVSK